MSINNLFKLSTLSNLNICTLIDETLKWKDVEYIKEGGNINMLRFRQIHILI